MKKLKFFLNEKNVFSLLVFVFIVITLGLALILVKRPQIYQKKATTGTPASLSLSSLASSYPRGEIFFVDLNLSTGGLNTTGTAVKLLFDPNFFEALEIIPGKDLSQPQMYQNVLRKTIDPAGTIMLDAAVILPNPIYFNGQGIFGKVKFKVKENAPSGSSLISFFLLNPSLPRTLGDCDVIGSGEDAGRDLLGQVTNITITVGAVPTGPTQTPSPTVTPAPYSPILKIKINFFGLSNEPDNPSGLDYKNQTVKVLIRKEATSSADIYQRNVIFKATTTGNNFYYENSQDKIIPNIQPGVYTLFIKGPKHLQKQFKNVNLLTGEQTLDFSSPENRLFGGDLPITNLSQDGKANSLDYNFLTNHFNKDDVESLKVGDLNLDGIINTGDTSVLAATLGEKADEEN